MSITVVITKTLEPFWVTDAEVREMTDADIIDLMQEDVTGLLENAAWLLENAAWKVHRYGKARRDKEPEK